LCCPSIYDFCLYLLVSSNFFYHIFTLQLILTTYQLFIRICFTYMNYIHTLPKVFRCSQADDWG
jgi:hypothetical protein